MRQGARECGQPAGNERRRWPALARDIVDADEGRRALYAARSPDAPTLSHTALQCIGSQTCAAFWGLLHNYACLDLPPKDWASVPLQHPFLCRSVDGRVRFVPPPDLDFD